MTLRLLLAPEARLVVACLDDAPDDAEVERLLASPLDWDILCTILDRESASAPVWRALERHRDRIPVHVAQRLRGFSRVKRFQMMMVEQRVAASVEALHQAEIRCILLKGAGLAASAYTAFTDRPMRDIDLLVRPREVDAALQVLLDQGWRPSSEIPTDGSLDHAHHLPPLVDAGGLDLVLELHRAILTEGHPFRLDMDDWWRRARPLGSPLEGAHVLAPEHLLLHACIHLGYHHLFRQGAWRTFRDIRRIVALDGFSWPAFAEAATQARASTSAYWVLRLARDLAGVPVPNDTLLRLAPPHPEFVKRALARHLVLVLMPGRRDCPSATARRILWSIAILPAWSGHNASRPWTLFDGPIGRPVAEEEPASPIRTPSWRAPDWFAYLGALLRGR